MDSRKVLSYYELNIRYVEKVLKETSENIIKYYPDRSFFVKSLLQCKSTKFKTVFERRRLSKFRSDQLNIEKAKDYQSEIFQRHRIISTESLFVCNKEGQSPILSSHLNEHEPIILNGNSSLISTDLNSLCGKGPSFIPTPLHVDWLQLQKDFDVFSNSLRARFIFKSS